MTYRYVDAPRHAQLRDRDLGGPGCQVAVTGSGSYAVVADTTTPPDLVGHALDYADRLAELDSIPGPRTPLAVQAPAPIRRQTRGLPRGAARGAALLAVSALCTLSLTACSNLTAAALPGPPAAETAEDDDEPHENL